MVTASLDAKDTIILPVAQWNTLVVGDGIRVRLRHVEYCLKMLSTKRDPTH